MKNEEVVVPKGRYTPMCYCGDNCKLVKCKIVRYTYDMRLFMCVNYAHDPIKSFDNVRPNVRNS